MDSIFTKIIKREIPSFIIDENEEYIAILDVFPLVKGHALVIPKKQIDYIFDLDESLLAGLNVFSKRIAKAIEKAIPCKRIGIAVIGLEVPHTHMHLVPMNIMDDINFSKPKLKIPEEEMQEILNKIKANL